MSLRMSVILSVAAVLVATLFMGAAVLYYSARQKVDTEMDAALRVGNRISMGLIADLAHHADQSSSRLRSLIESFDGDRHLRAELQDKRGEPVLTSRLAVPSDPVPHWVRQLLGGKQKKLVIELPAVVPEHRRIMIYADPTNEIGEVWSEANNAFALLAAFYVMTLACLSLMIGWLLRPLLQLSRAFGNVADMDFGTRLAESGPSELRQLTQGFNAMTERLQRAEQDNHRLQEQLAVVQDEERAEVARDLHDEIGSVLFSSEVDAAAIQRHLEAGRPDEARAPVQQLRESLAQMQRHVRDLLVRLRGATLLDAGLALAIENLVRSWRAKQPELEVAIAIPKESYGDVLDGVIYRIVQESLSNSVRHGEPTKVWIAITEEKSALILAVRDNGHGLRGVPGAGGQGLRGMRERAANIGGTLDAHNLEAGGFQVIARLPLTVKSASVINRTAAE